VRRRRFAAPKRVSERRSQLSRCGQKCYMDPDPKHPRYPVCPKGSCRPTCAGYRAAFKRAFANRERDIAEKAERIALRMGCKGFGKRVGRG
jgi:hypothetical protein